MKEQSNPYPYLVCLIIREEELFNKYICLINSSWLIIILFCCFIMSKEVLGLTKKTLPIALQDLLSDHYPLVEVVSLNNNLWIVGAKNVVKYDIKENTFLKLDLSYLDLENGNNSIFSLLSTNKGLWLRTAFGIYYYNYASKSWKYFDLSEVMSLKESINQSINSFIQNSNSLWIGTSEGLVKMDKKTNSFNLISSIWIGGHSTSLKGGKLLYGDDKQILVKKEDHLFYLDVSESRGRFVPYSKVERVVIIENDFVLYDGSNIIIVDTNNFKVKKRILFDQKLTATQIFSFHPTHHVYYVKEDFFILYLLDKKEMRQVQFRDEVGIKGDEVVDIGFTEKHFYVLRETGLLVFKLII